MASGKWQVAVCGGLAGRRISVWKTLSGTPFVNFSAVLVSWLLLVGFRPGRSGPAPVEGAFGPYLRGIGSYH